MKAKKHTKRDSKKSGKMLWLLRVSGNVVKHRKHLGKILYSVMFLFTNWDKTETMVRFKHKK